MPPKTVKEDKTAEAIKALAAAIKSLETVEREHYDSLMKLVGQNYKLVTDNTAPKPVVESITPTEPIEPAPKNPFPKEWRDIVDTVLNAKFKAEVDYQDGAQFILTIYVPKEYSNAAEREWETYKADRRVKIMPIHLGAQGVKDYAELVAENLGPEIRAKIAEDRAKLTA